MLSSEGRSLLVPDFGKAKHALGLAGEFNFYGGLFFWVSDRIFF